MVNPAASVGERMRNGTFRPFYEVRPRVGLRDCRPAGSLLIARDSSA
jgi:hypothetical protein